MLRLISRLLLAFFILALLAAGSVWLLLHGSLPKYSGTVSVNSLAKPVIVERDSLGSVTIRAQDRHEMIWALGYVHAQERFFEMDLMTPGSWRTRRAVRVSRPAGGPGNAKHRMRSRAVAALEQLPAEQRKLVDIYRDGVNHGLDALATRPFPYLLTRTDPPREDSILVVKSMYFTLNDVNDSREIAFSTMRAALPESAYRFLTGSGGEWDAPLIGEALDWPQPPPASQLDLRKLDPGVMSPKTAHP